jgi:hypothetical protein
MLSKQFTKPPPDSNGGSGVFMARGPRRYLVATAASFMITSSTIVSGQAAEIDFDSLQISGPSIFSDTSGIPQDVTTYTGGYANFDGGTILSNTALLPANQTSVLRNRKSIQLYLSGALSKSDHDCVFQPGHQCKSSVAEWDDNYADLYNL